MTIQQCLTDYLAKRGLWPNEAAEVVKALAASSPAMAGRWEEEVSGYPESLMGVLVLSLRQCALDWIDANEPKHFARAAFTG